MLYLCPKVVIIMIGNVNAVVTIQVKSTDPNENSMSRTLSADMLNQTALKDNSNSANPIDIVMRAIYGLSTNTYSDSIIIGKSSVNEIISG